MRRQVKTSPIVRRNLGLLLPVLPPEAVIREVMPTLSGLFDEGLAMPFRPEPLGLTQQRLAAPLDPVGISFSPFVVDSTPVRRSSLFARAVSCIPRRRFFRPFRRWIARRWQRFDPRVDPGFIPGPSLAHLETEPVIDDDDNLLRDLEEEGVTAVWSVLDYAWTPGRHWERTWVDGIHEQDYLAWARMAILSRTDLVMLDLGQSGPDILASKPAESRRFRRSARRVDRRIRSLLYGRSGRRIREAFVLFVESPVEVEEGIDLERILRAERFEPGRDYVAVIHPTFAQVWSLQRESGPLLAALLEKPAGTRVHPGSAMAEARSSESGRRVPESQEDGAPVFGRPGRRRMGDWIVTANPGVVFRPNHFDGVSPRRTGVEWADPPPESRGLVVFAGGGWGLPRELPREANVEFLRSVIVDTLLPEAE